jgi:hypothetical protein
MALRSDIPMLAACLCLAQGLAAAERWGIYEVTLAGPQAGNPYLDVQLSGHFRFRNRVVDAEGFYDGEGSYRIRFMPDETGEWAYTTSSNAPALDRKSGSFTVTAPAAGNHGPVRVRNTTHFG